MTVELTAVPTAELAADPRVDPPTDPKTNLTTDPTTLLLQVVVGEGYTLPRDRGIEGCRTEGWRGLRDCGKRVLLNHLSPRGLVGFDSKMTVLAAYKCEES